MEFASYEQVDQDYDPHQNYYRKTTLHTPLHVNNQNNAALVSITNQNGTVLVNDCTEWCPLTVDTCKP